MINDLLSFMPTWSQLADFHLLRPWWSLLLVPSLVIYWLLSMNTRQAGQWQQNMSPAILSHLTVRGTSQRWFSPKNALLIFMLLSTVVLTGPSWQRQASPLLQDESVLVIALDLSESMANKDLQPSRLLRAKQKISELIKLRGDAKTGLIAFAGSAHVAMPVSRDQQMVLHFLDALQLETMPKKQKDQTQVLTKLSALADNKQVPVSLLLLTDSTNSEAISQYQDYFKKNDHQLIVWGINHPTMAINEVDNTLLQQLADSSGGDYVPYSLEGADSPVVNRHIARHMINADDSELPWQDAGYALLYLLAAIQLLWFRKGWVIQW